MGTIDATNGLAEALFSKNRRMVLSLLLGHADEAFYLRQIVRASGGGVGAIQRELRQLVQCGILRRTARGKEVYFQVNFECPVFAELKSLLMKTAGLAERFADRPGPAGRPDRGRLCFRDRWPRAPSGGRVTLTRWSSALSFSDVVTAIGPGRNRFVAR